MSLEQAYNSFTYHAAEIFGSIFGATGGYVLFSTQPADDLADLVSTHSLVVFTLKVLGVIFFSAVGGATGFFVKRLLEKKYEKDS